MTKHSKIFTIIWSIFAILSLTFTIYSLQKDNLYKGKDLRFNLVDRDIQIKNEKNVPITIEAYSRSYFEFRQDKKFVFSTPIDPPSNWPYKTYYELKNELSTGNWDEWYGGREIIMSISSQENTEVVLIRNNLGSLINITVLYRSYDIFFRSNSWQNDP